MCEFCDTVGGFCCVCGGGLVKTAGPEPVAHLYRYHCKPCNHCQSTTGEDDSDAECEWCGADLEAFQVIPLFEDEPAAINCLRRIISTWAGDSQDHCDAVNAGRELVEGWDESQISANLAEALQEAGGV